jgi:type III secretion protein J
VTLNRSLRRAAFAALVLALVGCQTEVQHQLTETEANDIYVLLDQNGIPVTKSREEGGREITWKISVPQARGAAAMLLLKLNELPRTRHPGMEIFNRGSLIPTATEERAMYLQALSGELARTLSSIDGVLDARVHVNLPQVDDLADKSVRPEPSAAVFLKYRSSAEPGKRPVPPISDEQVQALVSRAVQDLKTSQVVVVTAPAAPPHAESKESEVDILGVRMASDSARTFQLILAVMVVMILGLAGWLAFILVSRSNEPRIPRVRPKTEA